MQSIEQAADRIEALASPSSLRAVSASMGAVAAAQYRRGFDKKVDPYGTLWPPRRDQVQARSWKQTAGTLLVKSGALRDDVRLEVNEQGFRLTSAVRYSSYLHFGTGKMAPRALIPAASKGLGQWGRPLELAATAALKGLLK